MYLWRSLRGKVHEATRGSIIFDTATGEILGAATWGPTSGGLHMADGLLGHAAGHASGLPTIRTGQRTGL